MINFKNSLEAQLVHAARRADARELPARRLTPGRLVLAASVAVAACVVAVALGAGGATTGSAEAHLPILDQKAVSVVTALGRFARLRTDMDLRRAHPIRTPQGTGYVLTSADSENLCLAVPDGKIGYGSTCAPTAKVRTNGLVATLMSPSAEAGPSEVVIVLPQDTATATMTTGDGPATRLAARDGVVAASVTEDTRVAFATADGQRTLTIRGHEPQRGWAVGCKDGRTIPVPTQKDTYGAARERYCGDES
jgi:hypothetical protein